MSPRRMVVLSIHAQHTGEEYPLGYQMTCPAPVANQIISKISAERRPHQNLLVTVQDAPIPVEG